MFLRLEVYDNVIGVGQDWCKEDETSFDKIVSKTAKQKVAFSKMLQQVEIEKHELTEAKEFDAQQLQQAKHEQKETKDLYDIAYQETKDMVQLEQ